MDQHFISMCCNILLLKTVDAGSKIIVDIQFAGTIVRQQFLLIIVENCVEMTSTAHAI